MQRTGFSWYGLFLYQAAGLKAFFEYCRIAISKGMFHFDKARIILYPSEMYVSYTFTILATIHNDSSWF